jgi:hypothetical protein
MVGSIFNSSTFVGVVSQMCPEIGSTYALHFWINTLGFRSNIQIPSKIFNDQLYQTRTCIPESE